MQHPEHQAEIGFYSLPALENGIPLNGFAQASLKIVEALNSNGIKTLWMNDEPEVGLSFSHPPFYGKGNEYRIGYSPWESTVLPNGWVRAMNDMDDIWAPSNWLADIFQSNGVTRNIQVVPHGVDIKEWPIKKREMDEPFYFLHVGEPAPRKNAFMVVEAFQTVFGRTNKPVKLLIKSMGPTTIEGENVEVITDVYNTQQMADLFMKAHCMVYPSNAEGFGLLPLQAIATGMPTIIPPYSGMVQYAQYAIPLRFKIGKAEQGYLGEWCEPNFGDLCVLMNEIYSDYRGYANVAYLDGLKVREEFTWERPLLDSIMGLKALHF